MQLRFIARIALSQAAPAAAVPATPVLTAAVAAAVLGAIALAGCADPDGALFARLSSGTADAIEISHDDHSLSLSRDADGWWIDLPTGPARADSGAVSHLLEVLDRATRRDIVARGRDELRTLGFDEEAGRIEIRDGRTTLVDAHIGGDAPGASRVFLRPEGQRDVFVSPDGLREILESPLHDWRDRSIMRFRLPDVVGLELINRGVRMVIAPVDGRWHMTQPIDQDVYKGFVDGLLFSLSELEAVGFVSGIAPSKCGFGDAAVDGRGAVTVRLSNGPAQSVIFGAAHGDTWCVMRPDRTDVYLVDRELVELIFGDEAAEAAER